VLLQLTRTHNDKKTAPEEIAAPATAEAVSAPLLQPCVCKWRKFPLSYKQANLLQQALSPNKMRVGFCWEQVAPASIRVEVTGGETAPLIPDIANLTTQIGAKIQAGDNHKEAFAGVIKRLARPGEDPNIEEILTHIRALVDVIGNGELTRFQRLAHRTDDEIADHH